MADINRLTSAVIRAWHPGASIVPPQLYAEARWAVMAVLKEMLEPSANMMFAASCVPLEEISFRPLDKKWALRFEDTPLVLRAVIGAALDEDQGGE